MIRIAVIDTGVKRSHRDLKGANILSYKYDGHKIIEETNVDNDQYGHGTACCWIIKKIVDFECEIISIKALNNDGTGSEESIFQSLKWCAENEVKFINLSLGTYNTKTIEKFIELGNYLLKKGILTFTSLGDNGTSAIPACLNNYMSVKSSYAIKPNKYYYDKFKNQFEAYGAAQRVAWCGPDYVYLSGNSFATARVTGMIAKLIYGLYSSSEQYVDFTNCYSIIEKNSLKINTTSFNQLKRDEVIKKYNSEKYEIKKALVVPFNKEIHALLRNELNLDYSFEICDPYNKFNIGKNAYQLANIHTDKEKYIFGDVELFLKENDVDTMIISRTHILDKLYGKDILRELLEIAINYNKNIYSLEYLDYYMYSDLFENAIEKGIKIRHPMLLLEDLDSSKNFIEMYGKFDGTIPILGVFGTGSRVGKVTTQIVLRYMLKKLNYNVCSLGTEITSELLGFEAIYPMEMEASVRFDKMHTIEYLQGQIRKMELSKPDIILVGAQSGTIPYSYAQNSYNYTLPTLIFLMGTIPNAYILNISINDEIKYIQDTITVIEKLGKGKVILIVISDCQIRRTSHKMIKNVYLSSMELESYAKDYEKILSLPVTDVITEEGKEKMLKVILSFFSN